MSSKKNPKSESVSMGLLHSFMESADEPACLFGADGTILYANPRFLQACGLPEGDWGGRTMDRLREVFPDKHSLFTRMERLNRKVLDKGNASVSEEILQAPDGRDRLYEVSRVPLRDGDKEKAALVVLCRDVTDRAKREFEANLLTAEQTAIFENAFIGIFSTQRGDRVVRANRTLESMTGYGREELEERGCRMLFPEGRGYAGLLEDASPDLSRGESYTVETRMARKSGDLFWARVRGAAIDPANLAQGVVWCVENIEEERRVQRLREDTERVVRHDLKSPVNGIIGFADLIMGEPQSPDNAQFAKLILEAAEQMLYLINNSLDFFKMEEGAYLLCPAEVNLAEVLGMADMELKTLKSARKVDMTLFLDGRPIGRSGECLLKGEKRHLLTLFGNLMKNAVEASPEGGVVTVSAYGGDPVLVEIHNMGEIPAEIIPRFFHRYATSGKKGGTGLGTYSARLITHIHGGEVEFSTSAEEGTRVLLKLPQDPDKGLAITDY